MADGIAVKLRAAKDECMATGMKILFVFGTRPEAIKMAPLVRELCGVPEFEVKVCSTGQHREMLAQVLGLFGIRPEYDLGLMRPDQSLSAFFSAAIAALDGVIGREMPDMIMVQGDTSTALAASLSAFYRRTAVGHVEAGLRSNDRWSPFPEEMNRVLTTRLATLHFAPTEKAATALVNEGISPGVVFNVGNTVIDALLHTLGMLDGEAPPAGAGALGAVDFSKKVVLVTGHRRESFGKPFEEICLALRDLAEDPQVEIVYPVHLNPNVRGPVYSMLNGRENIHLVEPVDYPTLVWLLKMSYIVLTDSGGIQEEAPTLRKPVLVMREVTERMEGIESGVTRLVGTSGRRIVSEARRLLAGGPEYDSMASGINPYGDGRASLRIREILHDFMRSL